MSVRWIAVLGLAFGCKFTPGGALRDSGTGPGGEALVVIDAGMIDATDALAANGRRKQITIDGTMVAGMHPDFPVWIELVDSDIAARARPDGSDIFFTAADGTTRLDHDLQRWDPVGHKLQAWVRAPMLSKTVGTILYVNYGDPGAAPLPNPPGVFRSSFAAVWHFDDAVATGTVADATGTHAGTVVGSGITAQTSGPLGMGFTFDGGSDEITFTNPLSGTGAHTISVWVNQPVAVTNHTNAIVVVGTPAMDQSRWLYSSYPGTTGGNKFAAGYYAHDYLTTIDVRGPTWSRLDWIDEGGANSTTHLFVNGTEIAGSPKNFTGASTVGTTGEIGNVLDTRYGTPNGLVGSLDELRIATVARDKGWISTEYANQSSPATFYMVGPEIAVP